MSEERTSVREKERKKKERGVLVVNMNKSGKRGLNEYMNKGVSERHKWEGEGGKGGE